MVSPRQIRAARALIGWTQQTLADRAIVAINTVRAIERGEVHPKPEMVTAVRHALEGAGIVFLSSGSMGEGVRLAKPSS